MHQPTVPRLFWLFARTAVQRFRNRFTYVRQKRKEAKRKKLGLPEPERTATSHRNQKLRVGNVLGWLFMAYMLLMFVMMVMMSLGKAMSGVRDQLQPEPELTAEQIRALSPEQKETHRRRQRHRHDFTAVDMDSMTAETRNAAHRVTGLLMTVAGLGTLLFAVGVLSRQITRPEPSLGWLFEFPVPRGVLFTSKLCECVFDGASLPLLSMLPGVFLFMSGHGFWESVGWGLAFGLVTSLGIAALRIFIEVFLLQKCPRRRRGTIGGFCAAAGTLLMVVVLYGGGTPSLLRVLLDAAHRLPDWFYRNPLANGFGLQLTDLPLQWATALGVSVALCVASVLICARLTRYGLEPGLETARGAAPATGTRPASLTTAAPRRQSRLFSGLIGKEMFMLMRQRAVMVQVLLAPIVMVLMLYFQSSGRLAESAMGSAGSMASFIYGICAYMVLIASQVAMNTELRTLWLLLSLPRPLADSLRVKSRIWGTAAGGLALILGLLAMTTHPAMATGVLYRLPFIVIFVALIADLSVGIRTMGSSIISETTVHFRQWAQWMPLLLSAGAGGAVLSGDLWALCVQLVLLGALDVSVWQKMNVDLPYLTEPAEDPPPRLFLMHGLLAAYGYFALQMMGIMIASKAGAPTAVILPAASAIAAAIVALIAILHLSRRKVRIFPDKRAPWPATGLYTLACLGTVCAVGWGWLQALQWMRNAGWITQPDVNAALAGADTGFLIGFSLLAVVVAPVSEEFIFRGLVYHGLRREHGVAWSLLWSSLFFTAEHSVQGSVAVFILAAVNAWLMERTGRLTPCILVHMGYNAFVLWLGLGS